MATTAPAAVQQLLTVREGGQDAGGLARTLSRIIAAGQIEVVMISHSVRIEPVALEAFIVAQRERRQ